jgi:hypothetical protein
MGDFMFAASQKSARFFTVCIILNHFGNNFGGLLDFLFGDPTYCILLKKCSYLTFMLLWLTEFLTFS